MNVRSVHSSRRNVCSVVDLGHSGSGKCSLVPASFVHEIFIVIENCISRYTVNE